MRIPFYNYYKHFFLCDRQFILIMLNYLSKRDPMSVTWPFLILILDVWEIRSIM